MYDVAFLHPPVSFEKFEYPLGGLFESATGTGDLLAMMPVGMLSLANELQAAGLRTVVVNLAKQAQAVRYDQACGKDAMLEFLMRTPARLYGIGLHWAAHASGSLELARICKRQNPDAFVMLGGLSATYFTEEILREHPYVDAVVRGECDGHMVRIAHALLADPPRLEQAPNLAWRDGAKIHINRQLAPDLSAVDYLDTHGLVRPEPDLARMDRDALLCNMPVVRGCNQECLFCGGSRSAYRDAFGRERIEVMPVERVVDHVRRAVERGMTGVKFFGDLRLGGKEYVRTLIDEIGALGSRLDIFLELFWPADREFLQPWRRVARDLHLSFSPESTHPDLRRPHGKTFDNQALLEQARVCRELDIGAWFFFTYLLPGHTGQNLLAELEFLEQLMRADPETAVMALPYLFMDPAAPIYESPERYGFTIRLDRLSKIKTAMDRAYWFHAIGYRTREFSELDFHRAILDMTLGQARIYFETGRQSARDLLKTRKNVECHRAMGELIERNPELSDERLQATIEQTFPDYLRRSNSSLLIRAFFGESIARQSSPEAMIYDAFPSVFEILLRSRPDSLEETFGRVDSWNTEHRADLAVWHGSAALPPTVLDLVKDLLEPLGLPPGFVLDLARFEWDIYRLLFFPSPELEGPPYKPGLLSKRYEYDLVCIDELVGDIVERGEPPTPHPTHYLFDLRRRQVLALNFDPVRLPDRVEDARIRRLCVVGRRLVRAEPAMLRVIGRVMDVPAPMKPDVLCDGRSLSAAQIDEILSSAHA